MENIYTATPTFESQVLNQRLGKRVFFKMESCQPTRSFKIRGMDYLVKHHMALGDNQFIGSSGGNAGFSLAYVGRKRGATVKVFVPESTLPRMVTMIEAEGAEVIIAGPTWQEANERALVEVEKTGAIYVSPFDNPLLWKGHASLIEECAKDIPEPDLVVAAVGGGGLFCGIMEGMEASNWNKAKFLAAETHGAASLSKALLAGKLIELETIDTIATSLGAKRVAEEAFRWAQAKKISSYTCSDREALIAIKEFVSLFNILVEPACGAAISSVVKQNEAIKDAQSILVIACGGAAIDLGSYYEYARLHNIDI